MPVISISFSGHNREALDHLVTHFFKKEGVRREDVIHIHYSYYQAYTCQLLYFTASEVSLRALHSLYSYDPVEGLDYEQHRDDLLT